MFIKAVLASCLVLAATAATGYSDRELAIQLDELVSWWLGEYDNHEQIVRQSGGGLSDAVFEPHFRIHGHYVRVDLPSLGEHVLYIEEYKNGDPDDLYRIRLLSLVASPPDNGIVGQLYTPPDPLSFKGTYREPEMLGDDVVKAWKKLDASCQLVIEYRNGRYVGSMREKTCRVDTTRGSGDKDGYFDYEFSVGPDSYWFRDAVRRLKDDSPGQPRFFHDQQSAVVLL